MHYFSVSKLLKHLMFNLFRFHAAEGDGGGGGVEITPEIQALIDAKVSDSVKGLKAKNEELIGAEKKLKDQMKQFEGIDPIKTKEMLARLENDAEAKLIAEGKINEVIEARTEKLRAELGRQVKEAQEAAGLHEKRAKAFEGRVLDDALRAAATSAGLHQHAIEDALFRGRAMFKLDPDGKAVQLGDDGQPVLGKDGKSPFTPSEWLESMKETAPHWFPAGNNGSGGGAGGLKGPQGAKTMQRSQFDQLDPVAKKAAMDAGTTLVD
jgi:hypothetical protein